MNFEVDDAEANHALDHNQQARQRDFGVDNGCAVSINTGTLGSGGNALTVAAGDIMFNGSSVSVTSQSVDIDTGGTNPRQDVVYLDSTGSVVVSTGTPEAVFPSNDDLTTFEYQRPAPNDLSETDAVVLCAVWVAAGATSISASDVRDRRVSSTASFTSVDTEVLSFAAQNADAVAIGRQPNGTFNAYGSITAAVNDGSQYVGVVADEVQENGIPIPLTTLDEGFTIEPFGGRTTIIDPDQDGTPIFDADVSDHSYAVEIGAFDIEGGDGSGPVIDANFDANGFMAHRWTIRNLNGKYAGPIIIVGADELTLEGVSNQTYNIATTTLAGSAVNVGAGLVHQGQNTNIQGGDFANQQGKFTGSTGTTPYGVRFVNCRNLSVIGGTQAKHNNPDNNAVAMWGVEGGDSLTFINPQSAGVNVNAPNDWELTQGIANAAAKDIDLIKPSLSAGSIVIDGFAYEIDIIKPKGSVTIDAVSAQNVFARQGSYTMSVTGSTSQNVAIEAGSQSRVGPNGGGTKELAKGRQLVQEKGSSTNPAYHIGGSGAGFYVDANGEVVVVDEAGNTTIIS